MARCIMAVLAITLSGCIRSERTVLAQDVTGGDASVGRHLIYAYGCGSCHIIPGVAEANGTVGPPLTGFASRVYIAGLLVNTPENVVHWVTKPQEIDAGTAMPDLGVSERQAHDIAAYLYTLQ